VAKGTDDSFFLYIENEDPQFDEEKTRSLLDGLSPTEVGELED